MYSEALEFCRDNAHVLHRLGAVLAAMGRTGEAIERLVEAARLEPSSPQIHEDLGNALIDAKRYADAETSYQWALAEGPPSAAIQNRLSMVRRMLGRIDEAIAAAQEALALEPLHVEALKNLGLAYKAGGDHARAIDAYRQAVSLAPRQCNLHYNLGVVFVEQRRYQDAIGAFCAALSANRFYSAAQRGLGLALEHLGHFEEAVECYQTCLRRDPRDVATRLLLGAAYQKQKRINEAIEHYRLALAVQPANKEARNNLGTALQCARRWDEAAAVLRALVADEPDFAEAWNNLGMVLGLLDELDAAQGALRRAIELRPRYADAHRNLGNVLLYKCRPSEAAAAYKAAQTLDPSLDSAIHSEGVARLLNGELARGWALYEKRFALRSPEERSRYGGDTRWRGQSLAGKRILVHAEQGLGDTLQFARYLPLLASLGAEVHAEVQAPLKGLVAAMNGVRAAYAFGEALPAFDFNCPMMSLPLALGTTLKSVPSDTPYMAPPSELAVAWRQRIPASGARRVGFVWAGNPGHENDHRRSIPLEVFRRLFEASPETRFFSLQQARSPDLAALLATSANVTDLSPHLHSFEDTAAAIARLDLVIAVDTSVAHLAGALGAPLWVLLPFSPDWRWLLGRTDSPWYPSATLFRQPEAGDWNTVLADVAELLRGKDRRRSSFFAFAAH